MKRQGITIALPLRMKQTQAARDLRAARIYKLRAFAAGDGPMVALIAAIVGALLLVTSWLK
jgi:D-Tyr-tRNAtyr deacylase